MAVGDPEGVAGNEAVNDCEVAVGDPEGVAGNETVNDCKVAVDDPEGVAGNGTVKDIVGSVVADDVIEPEKHH